MKTARKKPRTGLTYAQIGEKLGISKVRVIQLERQAMRKLRARLAAVAKECA
jgi:DNA-directed RNA polymerase sigma subunit (sigma70/sigma32)